MSDMPKTSVTISGDSRYSDYQETDPAIHFVPNEYVRKRTRHVYRNLSLLFMGMLALSIPIGNETSGSKRHKVFLKTILRSCYLISSVILVPFTLRYLRLHYSIVIGALGLGVTSLIRFIRNSNLLSTLIIIQGFFDSLFGISKSIYITRLAMISVRLQGKTLSGEFLAIYGLENFFRNGAVILFSLWGWVSHNRVLDIDISTEAKNKSHCGEKYCSGTNESTKSSRSSSSNNEGDQGIFMGLVTAVALSGIILIGMYMKPVKELGDDDLAEDPEPSSPLKVLNLLKRPGVVYLAAMLLIADMLYFTEKEFRKAYLECWYSYKFKELTLLISSLCRIFGFLMPFVLTDLFGIRWLLILTMILKIIIHGFLLNWKPFFKQKIYYYIVLIFLSSIAAITNCIFRLMTIRIIGDQEVSAWCLYYGINDVIRLLWYSTSVCTGPKLWMFLVLCIILIIINELYYDKFGWKNEAIHVDENCMQLIETKESSFERPASFDLTEVVENIEDIEKIETLLKRTYILVTKQNIRSEENEET